MGTAPNLNASGVSAEGVFDQATFLASAGGDLDLLHELAQLFLDDCPQRLSALRDALARRDRSALESAAHTLKGSAGYIGAAEVFAAAAEVEAIARCGDLADADFACDKLQQATVHLVHVLAAIR